MLYMHDLHKFRMLILIPWSSEDMEIHHQGKLSNKVAGVAEVTTDGQQVIEYIQDGSQAFMFKARTFAGFSIRLITNLAASGLPPFGPDDI